MNDSQKSPEHGKQDDSGNTKAIKLTVAHTGFGGNAYNGAYFYRFSPPLTLLGKKDKDVQMTYTFDPEVSKEYHIKSLITSDSDDQIYDVKISPDKRSVSFKNRNTRKTLIFSAIVVTDKKRNQTFCCDPQVGNDPEIEVW